MVKILNHSDDDDEPEDGWKREKKYPYPALHRLSQDVVTFPQLIQRIDQILDKFGKIRDNATLNFFRFAENWQRQRAASHVPYIVYCARHKVKAS